MNAEIKGIVYSHHVILVIACKYIVTKICGARFCQNVFAKESIYLNFALQEINVVVVAQLVRASDCGSEGRGFEPHHPPANSFDLRTNIAPDRSFFMLRNSLLPFM